MQSKQTEALKKVLTELCWYEEAGLGRISTCDAIHTAREALAEQPAPVAKPHEQEPIAYLHQCGKKPELKELSFKKNEPLLAAKGYKAIPLTSPPAQHTWVGLTDEELEQAWRSLDYTVSWEQHRIDIARVIEAKLKEKNNV
jgi:hypothetical protein